jgi:hypothetical protein
LGKMGRGAQDIQRRRQRFGEGNAFGRRQEGADRVGLAVAAQANLFSLFAAYDFYLQPEGLDPDFKAASAMIQAGN